MLVLLNKNGFRGGDAFQKNTIDAININLGSNVNFKPLFEEHKCDDKIYIQVFLVPEANKKYQLMLLLKVKLYVQMRSYKDFINCL